MPEQLRIYLLGDFVVQRGDAPVAAKEWHTRQARQLLKLLLTERGRTVSAERIIEALWPERGENAAKTLRSAINALRAVLEPGRPAHTPSRYIITRYSGYSFAPAEPESVWIDAAEFERGLDQSEHPAPGAPTAEAREKLSRTLELYRGDYLSEDLYEEWATRERERLRERYLQGLEKLAGWQAGEGDFKAAIETCRKALNLDNCREPVYRALMSYQAAQGDMAAALQSFERCRRTLAEELGADPSPQTLELHQIILSGGQGGYPLGGVGGQVLEVRGQESGVPEQVKEYSGFRVAGRGILQPNFETPAGYLRSNPRPPTPDPRPLFVGREGELAWLAERLEAAQLGQGATITLVGEAGIGKTFLAQRLLEWAEQRGTRVLTISCQVVEQALPFAPVIAALGPFLRQLSEEDLKIFAPAALAQVALLLPALRDRCPDLPAAPDTNSVENRSRLIDGLVSLFEELARRYGLALFYDDAQWADEATLLLLNRLARMAAKMQLLLLVAYRSEDLSENETLHLLLRYLSRDRLVQPLLLQRFTAKEVAQFLDLYKTSTSLSAADLYQATQGNALFLAEAIRTLTEASETPDPRPPVPDPSSARWLLHSAQIRDVVLARLERLDPTARKVLELAATIGRPFASDLLQVTLPPDEWAALDTLLQRRFLIQQSDGRLAFSHEVVREVVDAECSPLARHRLHRQVAEGLCRLYSGRPEPHAAEMVFHFKRAGAGSDTEILRYAVAAGDYLRRTFSYRYALTYYDDALMAAQRLGPAITRQEEIRPWIGRAYQGRGLACEALLDWEGVKETYRRLEEWAEVGGDKELAESCQRHLATTRALMGHLDEAASFSLSRVITLSSRKTDQPHPTLLDLTERSTAVLRPPTEGECEGHSATSEKCPKSKNSLNLNNKGVETPPQPFPTPDPQPPTPDHWPPFCLAPPVPGEPWRELPEMLGVTQSALLLFQYGWALLLQGRPEAEQCLNAALAAAEETDQVACWVLVALQLSQLYLLKGDFEAAENWLQRCLSRGQQAPEADWATLWPRIFRAYLRMGSGQLEKAQESFKRLQADLATRADFYSHRHSVEIGLGLLAVRQGDVARAEEILQSALKARTQLYNDTYVLAMNSMAWIEFRRGDLAAARARLRQSLAFSGRRSLLQNYAVTTLEIARMELKAGGNLAAVEALLRHAVQLTEEAGFYNTSNQLNTALNDILAAATVNG